MGFNDDGLGAAMAASAVAQVNVDLRAEVRRLAKVNLELVNMLRRSCTREDEDVDHYHNLFDSDDRGTLDDLGNRLVDTIKRV